MFPLQFDNIFLTYQTSVANLHPLRVELRCKLQEKLPRVTGPIVIVEFELTGGCSIAEKSDDVHRGSWIQGYRIGYVDLNVVRYSSENQRVDSYFVCQCSIVAIAKLSKNLYDMHLLCYLVCTQRTYWNIYCTSLSCLENFKFKPMSILLELKYINAQLI